MDFGRDLAVGTLNIRTANTELPRAEDRESWVLRAEFGSDRSRDRCAVK